MTQAQRNEGGIPDIANATIPSEATQGTKACILVYPCMFHECDASTGFSMIFAGRTTTVSAEDERDRGLWMFDDVCGIVRIIRA